MWPGDSRSQRHMWVEFVASSRPCSERFFSGYSSLPLSSKTNISKFQFDLESEGHKFISLGLLRATLIKQRLFIYLCTSYCYHTCTCRTKTGDCFNTVVTHGNYLKLTRIMYQQSCLIALYVMANRLSVTALSMDGLFFNQINLKYVDFNYYIFMKIAVLCFQGISFKFVPPPQPVDVVKASAADAQK